MTSLQITGLPVSLASHDVPMVSDVVGGAAGFPSLFERAIAAGAETETSAAAPEVLTDVPAVGERPAAPQPSPDAGGGQDRVEPTVDAVMALLMVAWSPPPERMVPDRSSGLAQTLTHVGDVQPSASISGPAAAGSPEASIPPGVLPTPVRTPEIGVDPVANPATVTQPAVSETVRAVEKDLRVTPSVVSQPAAAPTSAPAPTPPAAEPRVATPPEVAAIRLSAGEAPRVVVEITTDRQARSDTAVRDMVKPDAGVAVTPPGAVLTDRSKVRSDVARVDTAYTDAAASVLVEAESRSAPSVVSQPAAASTGAPTVTPPAAEPRVATPPDVTSIRLSAGEAPSVVAEPTTDRQARGDSSGRNLVAQDAMASGRSGGLVGHPSSPGSPLDAERAGARGDRLMTFLSAAPMQPGHDAVSRSSDASAEQNGGLPSTLTPVDGSAMVTVTRSEMAAGDSPFPQRRAPRIAMPSEAVEASGLEAADTDGVLEPRAMAHDGDRATAGHRSSRFEATETMRQDHSSAASDTDTAPSDRPSSSSSDGRPLGSDALAGAPRGEAIRSGSVAPPAHPRALVDQVADQIATTARLSGRRNETERVQLRLHPQALGELVIEVSWKESGIVAAIKAQSHVTGELLAGDLGRLKTALGEQGITVSDLAVQVGVDLREWRYGGQTPQFPARTAASRPLSSGRATPIADSRAWEPDRLIDIRV